MDTRVRLKRLSIAVTSMLLGTIVVLGTVMLINRFGQGFDKTKGHGESEIIFKRKQSEKKQVLKRRQPRPKPRRIQHAVPPSLSALSTNLSGIDFGLPSYDTSDLDALGGDLLGGANGVVMTDDTVDQSPRAISQTPIQFPPSAKAKGLKGYVVLSILIGVTGDIEKASVVESYPEGIFDTTALQGISQWKFSPALYQGKAVRTWARQRIRFDLSQHSRANS